MRPERQPRCRPCVEVIGHRDRSRRPVALADAPVLIEGRRPLDAGLVHALGAVDIVGRAVRDHLSQLGGSGRWIVRAKRLNDVVFDQWTCRPTVDGQVRVAIRGIGSRVRDAPGVAVLVMHVSLERSARNSTHLPRGTGIPPLSCSACQLSCAARPPPQARGPRGRRTADKVSSRAPGDAVRASSAVGVCDLCKKREEDKRSAIEGTPHRPHRFVT